MSQETIPADKEVKMCKIKVYKRRWFIITLFVLIMIMNQIPVFQYTIIANLVIKYYNVSALSVDWTSMISMATCIPMSLPSAYVVDRWGLRMSILMGTLGTALGLITNLFASSRDLFWVIMVGQTIVAIAQVPLITVIPRLAAVWFGPNEISTACSVGVFGLQFGAGIGFLLPSMFVSNHDNVDDIGEDIIDFQWVLVCVVIPIALLVLIYFPDCPPLPPSPTQEEERRTKKHTTTRDFMKSVKKLFCNKAFLVHMVAYSINIGVYAAIGTLINQIVLFYFPNSEKDVGRMGFCIVVFGMIGSLLFGFILDRTKKYKETTVVVFVMSLLGLILYMYSLESKSKLILYLTSGIVGLFTSAYVPVGYEFAIELTYPCPEGTTSGILSSMSQVFGIIFTHILAALLDRWGAFWSLSILAGFLTIGVFMTLFIPNNLRRQAVFERHKEHNREIISSIRKMSLYN